MNSYPAAVTQCAPAATLGACGGDDDDGDDYDDDDDDGDDDDGDDEDEDDD